jgi:ABC-2 type transport system ATP-binding protein
LESRSRYHRAVSFRAPASALAQELLARLPDVEAVEVDPVAGWVTVFPRAGQDIFHTVVTLLEAQRVRVEELRLERGRLDDVFRQITLAPDSQPAVAA